MNITSVLITVAIIGGVGILVGLFLGAAGIWFRVETNEQEEKIIEALPGNNCGGCGYPGCSGLAAAIVKNKAPVNQCPVGGKAVADEIAKIMGVESEDCERKTALVKCQGTIQRTEIHYEYTGIRDCSMMQYVPNKGEKFCTYGCIGYGNCVKACLFDAIHIVNGVAVVDKEKCKACKKCIDACPKHLIELVPYNSNTSVLCNSQDKGPVTMKACDTGCIGCGICAKNCPTGAIKVENFRAVIDYSLCTGCGICAEKCPKKSIAYSSPEEVITQ